MSDAPVLVRFGPAPLAAHLGLIQAGLDPTDYASIAIDAIGCAIAAGTARVGDRNMDGYTVNVTVFVPRTDIDIIPMTKRIVLPSGEVDPSVAKEVFPFGLIVNALVPTKRLPTHIRSQLRQLVTGKQET